MNYYEKAVNSFLSSVSSNMSAVYLPSFLVAIINLLEDYFKFNQISLGENLEHERTNVTLSYRLTTAYFLFYLIQVRRRIPGIRLTPVKGRSHDERFLGDSVNIQSIQSPLDLLSTTDYITRIDRVSSQMRDNQNIYPVFERRCPVMQLSSNGIYLDMAAVETLLQNSILYTKMAELICFQYLSRLSGNLHLTSHLEDYYIREGNRTDFGNVARKYVTEYQDNRCFYCNELMDDKVGPQKPRADHFVPWVFVKNSLPENLVLACQNCNADKLDRLPAVFYFSRLLKRNDPQSDFWGHFPQVIPNIDQRIEQWTKHYYLAGEQLSTGWRPSAISM